MLNEESDDVKQPLLSHNDFHSVNNVKAINGPYYDSLVHAASVTESHPVVNDKISNGPYYESIVRKTSESEIRASPGPASNTNSEETKSQPTFAVYKRRWYILIAYSLYACFQSAVWNTWGPIDLSSEEAFGWSDETIAWLSNWGPVVYVALGLFYPWLLHVKGLRWAVVSSMFFVALGTAVRCFTSEPTMATILIHLGQFFNGVGGPISTGSIPAISAAWFPPKERVTATALSTCINTLGVAIPFVLGPAIVTAIPPKNSTSNSSSVSIFPGLHHHFRQNLFHVIDKSKQDNTTAHRIQQERDEIMLYLYYQCGACVLLFLVLLIYFPEKPPRPPCASAITSREDYWHSLWSLRKKGHFLLLSLIYGISLGVLNNWSSVLTVNLTPAVSESEAGWIGFYATIVACVFTVVVGVCADYFTRLMKVFILIMFILGTGCFVVFALVLYNIIPTSDAILYGTIIGGNSLLNAAVPIMFELGCELAYPISEGAANGVMTLLNNLGGLIFLLIFFIPNVGTLWMNWTLIGSTAICIPMIMVLKSRFNRLEVDEGVEPKVYVDQEVDVNPSPRIQV
ncbi:solute carrier family 49 member 4-like [Biomphalaria glabrata]|uniref:Solute carrier family 49 member 4-like n=1 Tax=Biomphalaria glabrata TaxID=6526 RepID=A0A9W2YAI2_BIOGL|nr:solute carrier family 49 member 4-like [Biomphalaria glabrata]XP_055859786.1 solute carrier family 49 member 4-like [Biomphalaria glabrata]XP_055859787.1 solute carrier family 49 member 4-like [Biomphalaria glabrata]XP_055859789.1 solute carrier family 49 member 4-like [Biomphalaria glabrata]XP_055859790.1 solute carrier family 49 member 4-like [Biomphalaria glabrata]